MSNKEKPEFIEGPITYELEKDKEIGVFVLAEGKGSRLKESEDPELQTLPKPLVPINLNNRREPMLDFVINGIFDTGIGEVVLLTSSDPEAQGPLIEEHVSANYQKKQLNLSEKSKY